MIRTFDSGRDGPRVRSLTGAIGEHLRDMFDHMASGPMPDHLVDLIDQLEAAYAARQADGSAARPLATEVS